MIKKICRTRTEPFTEAFWVIHFWSVFLPNTKGLGATYGLQKKFAEHEPSHLLKHFGWSIFDQFFCQTQRYLERRMDYNSADSSIMQIGWNLCSLDDDYRSANHFKLVMGISRKIAYRYYQYEECLILILLIHQGRLRILDIDIIDNFDISISHY